MPEDRAWIRIANVAARLRSADLWRPVGWAACALVLACGSAEAPPPDAPPVEPARANASAREDLGPGRWRRVPPGAADDTTAMIQQLESIGYLSGSRTEASSGVVRHSTETTWAGLNLYTSGHAATAILMDMDGRELHRWSYPFERVWPGRDPGRSETNASNWRRAYLFENGDLLAIFEGLGLIKLDRNSNLLWSSPIHAHHDLEVMPGGDIYVLDRTAHVVPRVREHHPILEDFVVILGPDGAEKQRVSLLEAFENSDYMELLLGSRMYEPAFRLGTRWEDGDIFHTNTLEVLDGRIAERVPSFAAGRVLISLRVPSIIAVVDLDEQRVVWAQRGNFRRQHDPSVLDNGKLLLFDNVGDPDGSRILELDPLTGEESFVYRGSDTEPFFSKSCGTAVRLPNGNTIITESDGGRAFEVTASGAIVWEFYSPYRAGPGDGFIATLFELVRLPADFPTQWATGLSD